MCCLQILVQKGWLAKNMWYQNATLLGIFNISPTPRQFWVDGIPSLPSMGYSEQLLRPRRFVPIEVSSQEKHVSKNSKDSLPTPIRIHGNGKFTYMEWLLFMVNVGKYSIHGSYGNEPTPYDIYIYIRFFHQGFVVVWIYYKHYTYIISTCLVSSRDPFRWSPGCAKAIGVSEKRSWQTQSWAPWRYEKTLFWKDQVGENTPTKKRHGNYETCVFCSRMICLLRLVHDCEVLNMARWLFGWKSLVFALKKSCVFVLSWFAHRMRRKTYSQHSLR